MSNDTIQLLLVVIVLIFCAAWVIRRILKCKDPKGGCAGCSLYDSCRSKDSKQECEKRGDN